jgi:DNA-binding NarL/FixJ family response regulator
MAILYEDQYRALENLGPAEQLVLAHLALGYSEAQIKDKLAKRRDPDKHDTYEVIRDRVYDKLLIPKWLKPNERWQKAGKIYFSYTDMKGDHVKPRPGKTPVEEPEPMRVDDMDLPTWQGRKETDVQLAHVNGSRSEPVDTAPMQRAADKEEIPEEASEGHAGAPAPAEPPPPPADAELGGYLRRVGDLTPAQLRIFRELASGASTEEIASRLGKLSGTVFTQVHDIYVTLGLHDIKSRKEKRRLAMETAKLYIAARPAGDTPPPAHEPEHRASLAAETPSLPEDAERFRTALKRFPELESRLRDVFVALAETADIGKLSEQLSLAPGTVKQYIATVFSQLGIGFGQSVEAKHRIAKRVCALRDGVSAPEPALRRVEPTVHEDGPPEQGAGHVASPSLAALLSLADPASIEDVKITASIFASRKLLDEGYAVEYIVVPAQLRSGNYTTYIYVKRKT